MWGKEYDLYLKKKDRYESDKAKVFALIISQCDEAMRSQLQADSTFEAVDEQADVVTLLKMIKAALTGAYGKTYPPKQALQAWRQMLSGGQKNDEHLTAYYKRFHGVIERVELMYGSLVPTAMAGSKDPTAMAEARDKWLAFVFMSGAWNEYQPLMKKMEDDFTLGIDNYPSTMEEALKVLVSYTDQNKIKRLVPVSEPISTDMSFLQKQEVFKKGLCFKCGGKGHLAKECPKQGSNESKKEERVQGTQNAQWFVLNGGTNLATIDEDIEKSRNGWQM